MTIGQRIAQGRKELGLSQEALGERLGVSRQSIYKWESDAALPEIGKLVALSKLFGLSVGALLGVEEPAPAPEAQESGGLTEAQLKMVEEIAQRYIAARPGEGSPREKRFFRRGLLVFLALFFALFLAVFSLFSRLSRMDRQYRDLQNSVNSITSAVDSQIGGISDRVEEILKSQNNLTADYSTEAVSMDLPGNMVTFSFRAIPKSFSGSMVAWLEVQNEVAKFTFGPYEPQAQTFSGEVTVALTDNISLYIVFEANGKRETQLLDTYSGLYSKTLPYAYADISDNLSRSALAEPFLFTIPAPDKTPVEYVMLDTAQQGTTAAAELRMGFFKNKKLVAWAEPCEIPGHFLGYDEYDSCYVLPDLQIQLAAGDELCFAAVVTDEYGRESIYSGFPCILGESGMELIWPDGWSSYNHTPADWTY